MFRLDFSSGGIWLVLSGFIDSWVVGGRLVEWVIGLCIRGLLRAFILLFSFLLTRQ